MTTDHHQPHLRIIDLERLSVGESVPNSDHVLQCPACAERLESMRREARAFLQRRPGALMVERIRAARPPPFWKRWWIVAAAPLAATVVGVLALRFKRPEAVRFKGKALKTVVNGEVLLAPGVLLKEGDALSFVVETQRPGHVLVVDVEEGKPITAFVPFGGNKTVPVQKGRTVLNDSVTLDGTASKEWLVSLFCNRPVSLEELALPAIGPTVRPIIEPAGCEVEVLELTRSAQ
jgi:hypothetical protein